MKRASRAVWREVGKVRLHRTSSNHCAVGGSRPTRKVRVRGVFKQPVSTDCVVLNRDRSLAPPRHGRARRTRGRCEICEGGGAHGVGGASEKPHPPAVPVRDRAERGCLRERDGHRR